MQNDQFNGFAKTTFDIGFLNSHCKLLIELMFDFCSIEGGDYAGLKGAIVAGENHPPFGHFTVSLCK